MEAGRFCKRYPFTDSLWPSTTDSTPDSHTFADGEKFDVVVIGAGIAGATAALKLQAAGASVAVIDADEPGSGATGRSGGFVVPSFSAVSPIDLLASRGTAAEPLLRGIAGSGQLLFDLVKQYSIDCGGGQNGWFQPAHSAAAYSKCISEAEVWRSMGGDVDILSPAETQQRIGIPGYHGALVANQGGAVHPVKLVNGMLKSASELGAKLYIRCRATAMVRDKTLWRISTESGQVLGDKVLVCTNSRSTELDSRIDKSVVPLRICQIATEPLPRDAVNHLIGQGQSVADTCKNLFTYRFDEEWRLITGAMPALSRVDTRKQGKKMTRRLADILQLDRVPEVEFIWFGQASVTHDRLPAIYDIGPSAWAMSACNGRGLAASTMVASMLSHALIQDDFSTLPVPPKTPEPVKARSLQILGASLYSLYGGFRDARN